MARHTYKPPTGKSGRYVSIAIGLLATLGVFVVIPLSQKLNDIFQPPPAAEEQNLTVETPQFDNTDITEPPPEPQKEEEIEEMVEETDAPDLGFDASDLSVGGGGPMIMDMSKFSVKDAADDMMGEGMDSPPQATAKFPPQYPSSLLRQKITGRCIISCVIDAVGNVASTTVRNTSGHRELDQAALTALSRWKFKPATRGGRPVKGTILIPYNFEIK